MAKQLTALTFENIGRNMTGAYDPQEGVVHLRLDVKPATLAAAPLSKVRTDANGKTVGGGNPVPNTTNGFKAIGPVRISLSSLLDQG